MNLRVLSLARLLPAVTVLSVLPVLAACGGGGPSADATYTVTLRYCSAASFSACKTAPGNATDTDIPPEWRADLEAARARVESLVTAGLVPAGTHNSSGALTCGDAPSPTVTLDETVHGILILVTVIDLPAGTLASSGPCIVRTSNGLPLVAILQLSSAMADTMHTHGVLTDVAFHEMLHTIGFGTIWADHQPSLIVGAGTADSAFVGARALEAAIGLNGAPPSWTRVPLETGGSVGTLDSHWSDPVFTDSLGEHETMTGWVNPNAYSYRPLSATTLGSLRDLGYSIDMTKADPNFRVTSGTALRALTAQPQGNLSNDILRTTIRYADDQGAP